MQGLRIYPEINARRSVSFPASKCPILANASQAGLEKFQRQAGGLSGQRESLEEEIPVDDAAHNRFFRAPKRVGIQPGTVPGIGGAGVY